MTLDRRAWKTLADASSEDTVSTVLHDIAKINDLDSVQSALDAGVAHEGVSASAAARRLSSVLHCLETATQPYMDFAHDIVEGWAAKIPREQYSTCLADAAALRQHKAIRFLTNELGADPYGPTSGRCAVETVLSEQKPDIGVLAALLGDTPITDMAQLPKSLRHTFRHFGNEFTVPCNALERAAALGKAEVVEWLTSRIAPGFNEPYHSMFDLALTISGASTEADLPTRRGVWSGISAFGNLLAMGAMPRTGLDGWRAVAEIPVHSKSSTVPFDIASTTTFRSKSASINLVPLLRRLIFEGAIDVDECSAESGETLLQVACAATNIEAMRVLLEMGADASRIDPDKVAGGSSEDVSQAKQMIRAARAHEKVRQTIDAASLRQSTP